MTTLSRLTLLYGIALIQILTVISESVKIPNTIATKTMYSGEEVIGITSVAEVTSKDGKVFSTGGVKFHPRIGTKLNKNSNLMQPLTFLRKSSDGFATGTVQIYPGAVMASATSYVHPKNDFRQAKPIMNWPAPNNYYPQTTFPSRIQRNPLFPNYMFSDFDPLIPDFEDAWFRRTHPLVDI